MSDVQSAQNPEQSELSGSVNDDRSPCCGTAEEAAAENACCGSGAKAQAVAAGSSCCG